MVESGFTSKMGRDFLLSLSIVHAWRAPLSMDVHHSVRTVVRVGRRAEYAHDLLPIE